MREEYAKVRVGTKTCMPLPWVHMTQDWATALGKMISGEIRRHRKARGMSAQQLADACVELGHPIPRTVISNFENGRRVNITVAEVLILAKALDVPPGSLIFPVGYVKRVEALPGRLVEPLDAIDWLAGEGRAPGEKPERAMLVEEHRWAVVLIRFHRELQRRIRALWKSAWESEVDARYGWDPEGSGLAQAAREQAAAWLDHLHRLRHVLQQRGLVVPDLEPGIGEPASRTIGAEQQATRESEENDETGDPEKAKEG